LLRKEWNADIKNKLSSLLTKSPIGLQSLFFNTLFKDWVVVRGMFTKLMFGERSKNLGTAALAILAYAVVKLFLSVGA